MSDYHGVWELWLASRWLCFRMSIGSFVLIGGGGEAAKFVSDSMGGCCWFAWSFFDGLLPFLYCWEIRGRCGPWKVLTWWLEFWLEFWLESSRWKVRGDKREREADEGAKCFFFFLFLLKNSRCTINILLIIFTLKKNYQFSLKIPKSH
jgi:hypothetical protein